MESSMEKIGKNKNVEGVGNVQGVEGISAEKALQDDRQSRNEKKNIGESIFFAMEAVDVVRKKNSIRDESFKAIKQIINSQQNNLAVESQFIKTDDDTKSTEIERMSMVDEHLFANGVFTKIYQICFGHIASGEKISSHIMARVLAGESVDINLESKRTFVYDKDDLRAEQLLMKFAEVTDLEELLEMKREMDDKTTKNWSSGVLKDSPGVNIDGRDNDVSVH